MISSQPHLGVPLYLSLYAKHFAELYGELSFEVFFVHLSLPLTRYRQCFPIFFVLRPPPPFFLANIRTTGSTKAKFLPPLIPLYLRQNSALVKTRKKSIFELNTRENFPLQHGDVINNMATRH